jgi:tRNA A-37 threonylcarbamoyl transferase component Bud32
MLHQVKRNATISKNVLKAFKELHARKVCHGDVRVENILVWPDNSVVVIDFELSEVNAKPETLNAEMKEVRHLLGLKPA